MDGIPKRDWSRSFVEGDNEVRRRPLFDPRGQMPSFDQLRGQEGGAVAQSGAAKPRGQGDHRGPVEQSFDL